MILLTFSKKLKRLSPIKPLAVQNFNFGAIHTSAHIQQSSVNKNSFVYIIQIPAQN